MIDARTSRVLEHGLAYLQQGWKLAAIPSGQKGPSNPGWNTAAELIDDPAKLVERLKHGAINLGLCHQPSGTVALDVDSEAFTRVILDEFSIDIDDLLARGLRINSSQPDRAKAIFRCPDMPLVKINWPTKDGTKITDKFSVFELRSGPSQDVLPPSLHPSGATYEWMEGFAPWDRDEVPAIPEALLHFWRDYADTKTGVREAVQALCPWRKTPPVARPMRARTPGTSTGVIEAYNRANDVGSVLEANGYKRRGKRYLAPSSSTVIPGVVILPEGRAFSHHGSDPLADGYAHDAFSLFTILHHDGDMSAAVKDAAQMLGIERDALVVDTQIDLDAALAAQARRRAAMVPQERIELVNGHSRAHEPIAEPIAAKGPGARGSANSSASFSILETRTKPWPAHLLRPPGMVGRMVDWILQTSQQPQPELAVGASITMMGSVLGQKVMSHTKARTNFYVLSLAASGAGKDHARKAISIALHAAGMGEHLGGEEMVSGQGLLTRMSKVSNSLFLLDEFGDLVSAISGEKAANHERGVMTIMKKMFSSTATVYKGAEYANQKDRARLDITCPHAAMYCTSVPESFYGSLTSTSVSSGWLNRMLVITAPKGWPVDQEDAALGDAPQDIVEWIKGVRGMHAGGMIGLDAASPIEVPADPMAQTLMTQFLAWIRDRQDELGQNPDTAALAEMWVRAREQAIKLAVVIAVGQASLAALPQGGQSSLEVDARSTAWAIDFIKHVVLEMEREVAARVGNSEMDRVGQDVVRVISRGEETGFTFARLCTFSRPFRGIADLKKQMALLQLLQARDEIVAVKFVATNNRSCEAYVAKAFAPPDGGKTPGVCAA